MAFDVYGSVGPGTQNGLHRISEFMASRKGTSLSTERPSTIANFQFFSLAANYDRDKSQKTAKA